MGGIGIVFDALPQFGGMLQETLPKDAQGVVRKGAAGLFVDAGGTVIASSLPDLPPGAAYRLHKEWLTLDEGESRSYLESQAGVLYAMGCARSLRLPRIQTRQSLPQRHVLRYAAAHLTAAL